MECFRLTFIQTNAPPCDAQAREQHCWESVQLSTSTLQSEPLTPTLPILPMRAISGSTADCGASSGRKDTDNECSKIHLIPFKNNWASWFF